MESNQDLNNQLKGEIANFIDNVTKHELLDVDILSNRSELEVVEERKETDVDVQVENMSSSSS